MSGCSEQQKKKVQPHTEFENLFDNFAPLCVRAVSFLPLAPCRGAPNSKTRKFSHTLNSRTCSTTLPCFASVLFRFHHWRHVGVPRTAKQESRRQSAFENQFDNLAPLCFRAVSFSPLAPCPGAPNSKARKSSDKLNSRTCATTLLHFASDLFRFHHWRHVRVPRTPKQESPATD